MLLNVFEAFSQKFINDRQTAFSLLLVVNICETQTSFWLRYFMLLYVQYFTWDALREIENPATASKLDTV